MCIREGLDLMLALARSESRCHVVFLENREDARRFIDMPWSEEHTAGTGDAASPYIFCHVGAASFPQERRDLRAQMERASMLKG